MGTLLRRRYMGGGSSLPYDAEIEYLDIKKGQFINTNHIPTNDTKVRLKLYEAYATSGVIVGYINDTIREAWRFFYAVGSFMFDTAWSSERILFRNNQEYPYHLEIGNRYIKDIDTDTVIVSGAKVNRTYNDVMTIGRDEDGGFKIGYVQIFENDTLISDFIPVRVGSTGYMYDKVTKQLYGDVNGGSFSLGNDVIGGGKSLVINMLCGYSVERRAA